MNIQPTVWLIFNLRKICQYLYIYAVCAESMKSFCEFTDVEAVKSFCEFTEIECKVIPGLARQGGYPSYQQVKGQ